MKSFAAVLCICLLAPSGGSAQGEGGLQPPDPRAGIPAHMDPGHNTHQESVIFGCLGMIVVFAVLCTLLLWFIVERTKSDIRRLDMIIPEIAERMRKETITANGELMSGTLTASHEFETDFVTNEEVQLTAYRNRNEEEAAPEASAPPAEVVANDETVQVDIETQGHDLGAEDVGGNTEQPDGGRRSRRRDREWYERHERKEHRHSLEHHERHSPQRHSHDRHSTPHDRLEAVMRAEHSRRSRPPPPAYLHTYDNPNMSMNDERDYRRARRNGPVPAPKPANHTQRPVSAYVTSGNEYPDEAIRPISIIGIVGDEGERRPRRHGYGHGRRYKSLLYESHV